MNALIIDCSSGMNLIIIKDKQEFVYFDNNEKRHSDELLNELDHLLSEADLKVNQIDNICVCVGPGSFTGVRVAISICKGLAIGTGCKVFALTNFDMVDLKDMKKAIVVLDGFSEYVYARIKDEENIYDVCLSIKDLKEKINKLKYDVFVVDEKVQIKLKNNEILSNIAENNIKTAFLNKITQEENIEISKIVPVYLRASQAEIERNKKITAGVK